MSPSLSKVMGGLEVELDFASNFFLFHGRSLHQIEGQMILGSSVLMFCPQSFATVPGLGI